ncbi:hypothetical protein LTS08_000199 [Lithohypha guttulata]|nr:hypothetical protein LTS08_000199 [Lithohypha guttulata]
MPRATRASAKATTASEAAKPYSKTTSTNTTLTGSKSKTQTKASEKSRRGKDSHLYTDDNPSTTLKGTGFKDAATAKHTIELVARRSLLYQFQTINTMYHRAAHHPSSAKNANIQAAMEIFRHWLDSTYVEAKKAQRDFPLLKKDVVEQYLPLLQDRVDELGIEVEWTEKYVDLPKGKRLANVLMDDTKPDKRDLAVVRQNFLDKLVGDKFDGAIPDKKDSKLWIEDGKREPSDLHLKLIGYGFSPASADQLSRS